MPNSFHFASRDFPIEAGRLGLEDRGANTVNHAFCLGSLIVQLVVWESQFAFCFGLGQGFLKAILRKEFF